MGKFTPVKHIVRYSVILALVCYFGVIAVVNLPVVQQRLSAWVADELANLFHTEVTVGNISVGLLNRIIVQNVSVNDRSGKHLLSVSRLSAKYDPFELLFQKSIRIGSVQLFGLNAQLARNDRNSPANFQFIVDALAPKDTVKKTSSLDLRINTILIRRGRIAYDILSEAETPKVFNPSHIDIQNLSATLSLKTLTPDSLNVQLRRMSFDEQSGFGLKKMTLQVEAGMYHTNVYGWEVQLPHSTFRMDTLAMAHARPALFAFDGETSYATRLQIDVTPSDFQAFVPRLAVFDDVLSLEAEINGKGYTTRCPNLHIRNENASLSMTARAEICRWDNADSLSVEGGISQMNIEKESIAQFYHNLTGEETLPHALAHLGSVFLHGNIEGTAGRLTAKASLTSEAGNIQADMLMQTDAHTHHRTVSGRVASPRVDVGTLLNDKQTWGNCAFDVELKDFNIDEGHAESYLKGNIALLTYKQYEYRDIALEGIYRPYSFNGAVTINDPNGDVRIEGYIANRYHTPDINVKAQVRNLQLHNLHLAEGYEDTSLSGNLIADLTGNSIDNVQGKIQIDSLSFLAADTTRNYFLPHFTLAAGNTSGGEKQVDVHAPFIDATLQGNYSYRTLPASFMKYMQRYIPSLVAINNELPDTQNNFRFDIRIDNTDILQKMFGVPLEIAMPATLKGSFDNNDSGFTLQGYLPEFYYNGMFYESGTVLCSSTVNELRCQLRANKRMKKGGMYNFAVNAHAFSDQLTTTVNWGNNTPETYSGTIKASTRFSLSEAKDYMAAYIQIHPGKVILNDTIWTIPPSVINIDKDIIEIRDFLFDHEEQHIQANGRIGKQETDSCVVDINNIDLQYVMSLIQFKAVKFSGMASGKIHLSHVLEQPQIDARLNVKNFSLNDALLGQAGIKATWDNEIGGIRLKADMPESPLYFTNVDGYISPKEKGLDLHIQAGGTNLAFLQPFVKNIFTNMQGRVFGNVRLYGPFSALDLEGDAQANASMKINILNTTFMAKADSVRLRPGSIAFVNAQLSDPEGHTGSVTGELKHTKLKNLSYDFRFRTRNMLVYNTEKESIDFPFYGKMYVTGNAWLRGRSNNLNVDGNVRTDAKTSFTYVTETATEATSSQFITFVDRTPHREQESIQTNIYHHLDANENKTNDSPAGDIRINLQIEATPSATMRIIMDPQAGDYIAANGNGNLQINFYNKEDFQIFGNYTITNGIYKMSMQNIIRKDFTLQDGSVVSFNGNPKQANLNVQAVYTVNSASLNDLVADASTSKGTVRVNCLLNLTGELTHPTLKFDLELPTVSDEDRELVRSLTSTEEQMNTQIIYLLGIGKFYTYDYANNANQTDATSSLAFSTLSGQLNNMISQVIDSHNWNVGTNLSTGDKGWSDVEAEAILSGRLLNNRLIINGNFGYRDNPMRNTNFVGDFEAMWLLTPNGDFRLKGYNQTNDRYFFKSTLTTQGIGLMYKKDFTNWRELFDWMLLKRRGKRNTAGIHTDNDMPNET